MAPAEITRHQARCGEAARGSARRLAFHAGEQGAIRAGGTAASGYGGIDQPRLYVTREGKCCRANRHVVILPRNAHAALCNGS
jgi:hypothetical protein